ncbi:MAG: zf-HC2 domain-containing protein [Ignavibacteriales bacterium]|nr:zf-HC2 domain-containing protein [Ignavibacteriales bacterium]
MTHIDQQQRVSLYIDDTLNDKESSELFAHLAVCGECRSYMKISLRVRNQIANEELAEVPRSLDRRVLASVARENAALKRQTWYSPVWLARISIPLPAAVSIVFLLIVGSLLFSPLLTNDPRQQAEIPSVLLSKVPPGLKRAY